MELVNCIKCGRAFVHKNVGPKICDRCRKDQETEFEKVKNYLWDNPNATVDEVHEETGVKKSLILKFVKDGRLIAEGLDINMIVECERCGGSIVKGRFCKECQQELVDGFNVKGEKKNKKNKREMFIKDRIKKRKNK